MPAGILMTEATCTRLKEELEALARMITALIKGTDGCGKEQ